MKQEVIILGGLTIDQKLRVWQVGAQASKFGFYKLIVCIIKKNVMVWNRNAKIYAIGETEVMKFEVFILGQRIDQKRNKGWWRGSRERIEMEAQKVTELTIEEEDKEHIHLPLLVSSRCVSSEFVTGVFSSTGVFSGRSLSLQIWGNLNP